MDSRVVVGADGPRLKCDVVTVPGDQRERDDPDGSDVTKTA